MITNSGAKIIEDFAFNIKKTDEGLLIEVEDKITGEEFRKLLNKESVKNISHDPFFDLDTIYYILQSYKKGDNESLTLTEDGLFKYSCQVMLGNITKQSGFSIILEKQALDPQTKLNKSLNKLLIKVSKLEECLESQTKCAALEEMKKVNEESFNAFERRLIDKLEALENNLNSALERIKILEQPKEPELNILKCYFNPNTEFASKYIISEDHRAARAKETTINVLFAKDPLPAYQRSEFSFLILQTPYIMIGIASENCRSDRRLYEAKTTIGYCSNGYFYRLGGNNGGGLDKYVSGDKVTFRIDLQTGKVNIILNGKNVHEHSISQENLKEKYYPFIYTSQEVGCGAKFI